MTVGKAVKSVIKSTGSKRGRKRKPRGRKPANPEDKKVADRLGITVPELKKLRAKAKKDSEKKKKERKKAQKKLTKKENKELAELKKKQEEDIKAQEQGLISPYDRERRIELYPSKAAFRESNPLERKVGIGSGPEVGQQIMRGKAVTKQEMKELQQQGYIDIDSKRYGGKIKRRMGGVIKKGYGKAIRGY
jgi:hypothetical protein